ncbi:unnamed protein product [Closterium sp. NIES-64]|nr:unnamed protein product [Closterium sp. NIES-64]
MSSGAPGGHPYPRGPPPFAGPPPAGARPPFGGPPPFAGPPAFAAPPAGPHGSAPPPFGGPTPPSATSHPPPAFAQPPTGPPPGAQPPAAPGGFIPPNRPGARPPGPPFGGAPPVGPPPGVANGPLAGAPPPGPPPYGQPPPAAAAPTPFQQRPGPPPFGRPAGPPPGPPPVAGSAQPPPPFAARPPGTAPFLPPGPPPMGAGAQGPAFPPPLGAAATPPAMAQAAAAQALAEDLQSLAIGGGPGAGGADAVDYSALPRPAGVAIGGEDSAGGADGGEEALEGWGEGLVGGGLAEIEGNAHPRYFRMTCGAIPDSQSLRSRWHLPLGAVLQPLAPTPPGEEEVPVVNFGSAGIIRCRRCRTYVNPFVTFTDAGRRWRCNSCNLLNEVSHDYYCNLDSTGRRTDWQQRPELSRGSVEFVAPVEYMVRPPMPPTFFFLIDASVNNARSGVLQVSLPPSFLSFSLRPWSEQHWWPSPLQEGEDLRLSRNSVVDFVAPVEYMVRPPMLPTFFFLIDASVNNARSALRGPAGEPLILVPPSLNSWFLPPPLSSSLVAPVEYMIRPPMPPTFFFLIDASVNDARSGVLQSVNELECMVRPPMPLTSFLLIDASVNTLTVGVPAVHGPLRPPMPPTFFIIDASVNNARSGVLQVISDAIRACLDSLPGDTRTRIGFLLFDSALHFVSLKPSLTQPHILVISDAIRACLDALPGDSRTRIGFLLFDSALHFVISDAIRACLDALPGDTRTRIGFLLFDSALHFVSLKPSLTQPHILVSADIDDPYLPLPEDELLVNMHESRHVVEAFLDALPNLFTNSVNVESAMGPALKAMALLVSQLGGKVLLFQSTMPSLGAGRLRLRGDDPRLYGTDREHTVRCSEDGFYKTTAAEFSRAQICVDTFVFSSKYCDLASLGTLARYTGGQVYHFSGFHLANDGDKLRSQIVRNLTRETAWESVMRIRCSKGLKIATFHGHFFIRSSDLLAIPAADADKGYAVQISHEEAVLANQTTAYLQCALLYTSSCGERRIRVHTLAVPIVRDMAELYRRCDVGATAAVLAKIALDKSLTSRLEECRQLIQNKTTLALREYRILTAGSAALSRTSGYGMPPGPPTNPYGHPSHMHQPNLPQQRLVFPESLRLLPLYTLALCKCPALRGGFQEMGADARAAAAFEMMVVSVGRTLRMLYPRLIRVDSMAAQCGVQDAAGLVTLPRALPLATSSLDPQGAFLLDDSTGLTLWLGGALPAGTAAQIVGQDALNAPDISLVPFIPPPDSPLAARISAIVDALRSGDFPGGNGSRGGGEVCHQGVQLLRQGGSGELAFYHSFVEDRSATGMGYGEFVVHLARQVQVK